MGMAAFAYASYNNYPGGVALWKLHQQESTLVSNSYSTHNPALVHIDVAAAQQVCSVVARQNFHIIHAVFQGHFSFLATWSQVEQSLELFQTRKLVRFFLLSLLHQWNPVASRIFCHCNCQRFPPHDAFFQHGKSFVRTALFMVPTEMYLIYLFIWDA